MRGGAARPAVTAARELGDMLAGGGAPDGRPAGAGRSVSLSDGGLPASRDHRSPQWSCGRGGTYPIPAWTESGVAPATGAPAARAGPVRDQAG
jgi:hypothetical protein